MYKKCIHSFFETIGFLSIIFMIMTSIIPYSARMKLFYYMMCAVIPPYFFNFFTFHLKLFSKRLWIRRAIAMTFNGIVILATSYLFGYLRFEINSLINYGITILVFIVLTVFIYYVADKIEQQNLKLINQKLSEKNTSNME